MTYLPTHECRRCGHVWIPRKDGMPVKCPACQSALWNQPRRRKRREPPKKKA